MRFVPKPYKYLLDFAALALLYILLFRKCSGTAARS